MKLSTGIITHLGALVVGASFVGGIAITGPRYSQPDKPKPATIGQSASTTTIPVVVFGSRDKNGCESVLGLPDPVCTPGRDNPDVTQDTIRLTICNPKWSTRSVRPPTSYTTPLKRKQIAEYRYSDTDPAHYEEDHLISLELGGSPTDPANLWPESYAGQYGARIKDKVENALHAKVCAGAITLREAQVGISTDWKAFAEYYGIKL